MLAYLLWEGNLESPIFETQTVISKSTQHALLALIHSHKKYIPKLTAMGFAPLYPTYRNLLLLMLRVMKS